MPKRGIFEIIKDTIVGVLRSLRELIESIWYGKEYDKIQQERMINEIKNSEELKKVNNEYTENINKLEQNRAAENLKTILKAASNETKEEKNNPKEASKNKITEIVSGGLDKHIEAIKENSYQIIQDNIDTVLSESPNAYQCETEGLIYDVRVKNLNENNSMVNVSYKGRDVLSYCVEKTINEQGDMVLKQYNINQKIENFSDINVSNINDREKMDEKEFEENILKKAIETINKKERFFEYNGHIFDTRINKANQCIIYESTEDKFVLKKGMNKLDEQGFHKKEDMIKKLCFKGLSELHKFKDFENLTKSLKELGIDVKQLKNGEYAFSKNENTIFVSGKNINNTKNLETLLPDKILLAQIINFIKPQLGTAIPEPQKFSIEAFKNAVEKGDYESVVNEIKKIKVSSEILLAKQIQVPIAVQSALDEKQKQMNDTVIAFVKDEKPENINEVLEMLSKYDDIDTLSKLNYLIITDENIPNEQKNIFEKACEQKVETLEEPKSKIILNQDFYTSELQNCKMYHLDKQLALQAEEKIADLIKKVVNLTDDCQKLNKIEQYETNLTSLFEKIDDIQSLEQLQENVEYAIPYFVSEDIKKIYDEKCLEQEAKIYLTEFYKTNDLLSPLSFEEKIKQNNQIPEEIKDVILAQYKNNEVESANDFEEKYDSQEL